MVMAIKATENYDSQRKEKILYDVNWLFNEVDDFDKECATRKTLNEPIIITKRCNDEFEI